MHGLFPKRVMDAVLDEIGDHENLSVPILDSTDTGREFALVILRLLAGRVSLQDVSKAQGQQ